MVTTPSATSRRAGGATTEKSRNAAGLNQIVADFAQGCAIATVALEAAAQEPRLGGACADSLEDGIELVASCLAAAGQPDDLAHDRAVLAVAAFEGAFVLAKARRSVEPLRTVADQLRVLVDTPLDAPAVRPVDAPAVRPSRRSRSS